MKVRTNADTPQMQRKHVSWELRVLVFAVLSICSLRETELTHSAR